MAWQTVLNIVSVISYDSQNWTPRDDSGINHSVVVNSSCYDTLPTSMPNTGNEPLAECIQLDELDKHYIPSLV